MSTSKAQRHRSARARLALLAALVVQLVVPGLARGAAFETYSVTGYEVWFTPTVGTFVGTGGGSVGTLSAWQSSIEHSVVISPTGTITGGWATLYRLDGVRISGYFSDGTVQQTYDGPDCTDESHAVTGSLTSVSRSDSAAVGTGVFEATLVHHRAWFFGRCISYSASVTGTISLLF
ncbi:MAG TPA: hypothetical protein VK992_03200 [Candidatus Caenarcaniphilales bacterium]|nr:hypothetical protein [Candidatus Caenarcaniphilales bacterium]